MGRYRNVPREGRLCTYCDGHAIEDATHIIFKCPLYSDERQNFLQSIDFTCNDYDEMFCELLANDTHMIETGYLLSKLLAKRAGTV